LDMAMLPLEVTVYVKAHVISLYKEDNYAFLRYFFTQDIQDEFHQLSRTVFYDFDGTDTKQERFVTVFELYAKPKLSETADLLKEVLEGYDHTADVVMDLFTHDNRTFRLSNLDGIVKLEEIRQDGTKEEVVLPKEPEPVKEEPVAETPPETFNEALAEQILEETQLLNDIVSPFVAMNEGFHLSSEKPKEKPVDLHTVEKPKEEPISLETVEKPEEEAIVLEAPEKEKPEEIVLETAATEKEEPVLVFEKKPEEKKEDEEKITLTF
ncbi:MAG: hypothetical protein IIZ47_01460, partial [Erysipelotrichaceae bacterium]|nr:hypothetical protein [Erysipelotrichaceae bacterium]